MHTPTLFFSFLVIIKRKKIFLLALASQSTMNYQATLAKPVFKYNFITLSFCEHIQPLDISLFKTDNVIVPGIIKAKVVCQGIEVGYMSLPILNGIPCPSFNSSNTVVTTHNTYPIIIYAYFEFYTGGTSSLTDVIGEVQGGTTHVTPQDPQGGHGCGGRDY